MTQNSRSKILESQKLKDKEAKERKEETNNKIASRKAISVILRREATKALIEKKKKGSKRLLPKTVLEALHERITALRWESALKVGPFSNFLVRIGFWRIGFWEILSGFMVFLRLVD